jgi:hypothetical protein
VTARYQRHPETRLTAIEGEGVVLHLGTRRYFSVSETGLAVLEALAGPCTVEELVPLLVASYDVTPEDAGKSTHAFVTRCLAADLVVVAPHP